MKNLLLRSDPCNLLMYSCVIFFLFSTSSSQRMGVESIGNFEMQMLFGIMYTELSYYASQWMA